ncbi:hypothetical protein CRYUN_Cryun07bG0196100 [Craigia yunnanensis]
MVEKPNINELPPTECEVIQGSLPSCLDGAYIRNGPNPQYHPRGPYHLFDGDGMLHSLRISQGRATLCSRYVKTYKYTTERNMGFSVVPNFFSSFSSLPACLARGALYATRIIIGHYNPAKGTGLANTSLALFGNRLSALGESDLPYVVRLTSNGDIETLDRHDFDEKLLASMTAHPKVDPDSGEAFAFKYGLIRPFLTYFYFDANGNKLPDVPIMSMAHPSFLHDFAITKNYALFADIQIGIKPIKMIFRGGSPMILDPAKVPRVEIIPSRTCLGENGPYPLHDGESKNRPKDRVGNEATDLIKKSRLCSGVVKLDVSKGEFQECTVASRMYGPGCYGGEPFFVAKAPKNSQADVEEDDGYLLSYVHNENIGESRFLVMDAKSPNLDIVATVKLPQRVPYGFHGLFVKERELNKL